MKFINCFLFFLVPFAHLDPYPDTQHWIRVDKLVLGYLFIYLLHPCLMHKQINVRLIVQSTGKLWKKTEWPTARTNQTPDTGDIFFLNSKLFSLLQYFNVSLCWCPYVWCDLFYFPTVLFLILNIVNDLKDFRDSLPCFWLYSRPSWQIRMTVSGFWNLKGNSLAVYQ